MKQIREVHCLDLHKSGRQKALIDEGATMFKHMLPSSVCHGNMFISLVPKLRLYRMYPVNYN